MISISFKDFMALDPCERSHNLVVDCIAVPRKSGRAALARALDAVMPVGQDGIKVVRRKAVFRDRELAALFEWTADQLVIATPANIARVLAGCFVWSREHQDEVLISTVLPAKLQSAYTRWWGMFGRVAPVEQWHAALEPGGMTFLPPEPWREVRS